VIYHLLRVLIIFDGLHSVQQPTGKQRETRPSHSVICKAVYFNWARLWG